MSGRVLPLFLGNASGDEPALVVVRDVVVAGWTGRDPVLVEKHIVELEALGVRRPATTPIFYRVASSRVTLDETIEVSGTRSSGEVEFVLLRAKGQLWLGVGSDHTDREVEAYGVTVSKQMCDKPIAQQFWLFEDVAAHWEQLVLRSYIDEGAGPVLYQEGAVTAMLDPADLLSKFSTQALSPQSLQDGTLMFGGTLAARGGVRASTLFRFELEDPVRARKIQHQYRVIDLPLAG